MPDPDDVERKLVERARRTFREAYGVEWHPSFTADAFAARRLMAAVQAAVAGLRSLVQISDEGPASLDHDISEKLQDWIQELATAQPHLNVTATGAQVTIGPPPRRVILLVWAAWDVANGKPVAGSEVPSPETLTAISILSGHRPKNLSGLGVAWNAEKRAVRSALEFIPTTGWRA